MQTAQVTPDNSPLLPLPRTVVTIDVAKPPPPDDRRWNVCEWVMFLFRIVLESVFRTPQTQAERNPFYINVLASAERNAFYKKVCETVYEFMYKFFAQDAPEGDTQFKKTAECKAIFVRNLLEIFFYELIFQNLISEAHTKQMRNHLAFFITHILTDSFLGSIHYLPPLDASFGNPRHFEDTGKMIIQMVDEWVNHINSNGELFIQWMQEKLRAIFPEAEHRTFVVMHIRFVYLATALAVKDFQFSRNIRANALNVIVGMCNFRIIPYHILSPLKPSTGPVTEILSAILPEEIACMTLQQLYISEGEDQKRATNFRSGIIASFEHYVSVDRMLALSQQALYTDSHGGVNPWQYLCVDNIRAGNKIPGPTEKTDEQLSEGTPTRDPNAPRMYPNFLDDNENSGRVHTDPTFLPSKPISELTEEDIEKLTEPPANPISKLLGTLVLHYRDRFRAYPTYQKKGRSLDTIVVAPSAPLQ